MCRGGSAGTGGPPDARARRCGVAGAVRSSGPPGLSCGVSRASGGVGSAALAPNPRGCGASGGRRAGGGAGGATGTPSAGAVGLPGPRRCVALYHTCGAGPPNVLADGAASSGGAQCIGGGGGGTRNTQHNPKTPATGPRKETTTGRNVTQGGGGGVVGAFGRASDLPPGAFDGAQAHRALRRCSPLPAKGGGVRRGVRGMGEWPPQACGGAHIESGKGAPVMTAAGRSPPEGLGHWGGGGALSGFVVHDRNGTLDPRMGGRSRGSLALGGGGTPPVT